MSNSQIQQNSNYSSQSYSLDAKNIHTLKDIIQELKRISTDPSLSEHEEKKNDLEAEIRIMEGAISSSKPRITIIKESLLSAKNILETINSVSTIIPPLIKRIALWLNGLG